MHEEKEVEAKYKNKFKAGAGSSNLHCIQEWIVGFVIERFFTAAYKQIQTDICQLNRLFWKKTIIIAQ